MSDVEREADVERDRGGRPAMRRLGIVGLWLLGVLLFLLLLVPVLLLPVSTAVPPWVWILLLLGDLALAFWLLRSRRPLAKLVAVMAVVASQVFAATPPITDADGQPLPTSIASLEKVNSTAPSSGSRSAAETPAIRCCSTWAWVVPGAGGFATRSQFEPLEQHFTVVSWGRAWHRQVHRRGAAGSADQGTVRPRRPGAHRVTAATVWSAADLSVRSVLVPHSRHLADSAVSAALLRVCQQRADGEYHRE